MTEVFLQNLIGKTVFDQHNQPVGRIEEVIVENNGKDYVVTEYHLGTFAFFERLSSAEIGRSILRIFGAGRGGGLQVSWGEMDLSSPDRPTMRLAVDQSSSNDAGGRSAS